MKPRTIKYYFREGFRSLIANRLMSIASIFAVSSSLFIVSVFYIIGANVEYFVEQLEGTIGIVAIIHDDTTEAELPQIRSRIESLIHVDSARIVTRDEALQNMRDWFGEDAGLLEGLELNNPLRHSIEIDLTDIAFQEDVAIVVEVFDEVYRVRRDADIQGALITMNNVVRAIILGLLVVLGIISITIIINTIRITVNSRQTEINIMKYVGATDWFIRWPFIIEGMLIGLIGGAIPASIAWFGYGYLYTVVGNIPELQFLQLRSHDFLLAYVFPLCLGIGTVIGFIGSAVSVRRHLKV